jgi:hypothetical protein
MHVVRLLHEGIEWMRTGTITLPRPEKDLLITIRTGNYGSLEPVLELRTLCSENSKSLRPRADCRRKWTGPEFPNS